VKTAHNIEQDPDDPGPADEGDIQMVHPSDKLYSSSTAAVTQNYT